MLAERALDGLPKAAEEDAPSPSLSAPDWLAATSSEAIPRRHGRAVAVGGHEIAVFNLGDRFLAIDNHCPHEGGRLCDGIVAVNAVVCPLHGWRVSLETGAVTCPAGLGTAVPTYPTRVEGGVVMVAFPD